MCRQRILKELPAGSALLFAGGQGPRLGAFAANTHLRQIQHAVPDAKHDTVESFLWDFVPQMPKVKQLFEFNEQTYQTSALIAGEATNGSFNLGNYQGSGVGAILGVGLTDVLVNDVDLDADALLGILTTPAGLDEANFRAGAAGLLNAAGDGFLNTDSLLATLEVIEYVATHLLGDANHDGVVSAGDYASVQANFGSTGDIGIEGDANLDGVVSAGDYASVQANFGNVTPVEAVPEPATLSLLAIGGIALFRRKRA